MARYQLIASINHPDGSGWTKENHPKTWENYCKIKQSIKKDTEATEAKAILQQNFSYYSDTIEFHFDWTKDLVIDVDGDGIWLFKRLMEANGIIGGHPFHCLCDLSGSMAIAYFDNREKAGCYYPCEEDKDVLRPILEKAYNGIISEQKACEEIARIMKEWDYPIQL